MEGSCSLVHVLDDDAAVRRSLGRLLQIAGYRVTLYDTPFALIAALPNIEPGCLLLDVRMPGIDGLTLQTNLRDAELALIVMSGQGDIGVAVRAIQAGAVDFLEKPFSDDRLIAALDLGFAALVPVQPRVLPAEASQKIATLSEREREVLTQLAAGSSNKHIARTLGISVRTVEVHRARMLRHLGVPHLAAAIRLQVLAELAG
jgi:two-component system, LuxR family, response regulator FixJ